MTIPDGHGSDEQLGEISRLELLFSLLPMITMLVLIVILVRFGLQ